MLTLDSWGENIVGSKRKTLVVVLHSLFIFACRYGSICSVSDAHVSVWSWCWLFDIVHARWIQSRSQWLAWIWPAECTRCKCHEHVLCATGYATCRKQPRQRSGPDTGPCLGAASRGGLIPDKLRSARLVAGVWPGGASAAGASATGAPASGADLTLLVCRWFAVPHGRGI